MTRPFLSNPRIQSALEMMRAAPTPSEITISEHAAAAYQRRVKPQLDLQAATAELERLKVVGSVVDTAPAFVAAATVRPFYLAIADVLLPLKPTSAGWVATTTLTDETLRPKARQARNERRQAKTGRRAGGRWRP
jgi:hypothetical protein